MNRSIVIIDDDRSLLDGMKYAIPWSDFHLEWVGEAIDGREGIEVIHECSPDIVLTDINMPVMNGLVMIEQLRNEGFKGKFIILSGYTDFEYARQAMRLQVDDYLSKPISLESLRKVIERVMERLDEEEQSAQHYTMLQNQLELYKPYVVREWLTAFVTGNNAVLETIPDIQSKLADWTVQRHVLAGIEVGNNDLWDKLDRERNMIRFVIQNVVCEMVNEVTSDYEYIELHSRRFVILLHRLPSEGTVEQFQEDAVQLCDRLETYLKKQLKLQLKVEAGEVVESWKRIPDAFASLFQSKEPEDNGNSISGPPASIPFYHELAEAVRHGHIDEARRIITAYVNDLKPEEQYNASGLRSWSNNLWSIMAYSLYDIGIELDRIVARFSPAEEMTAPYNPASLREWLLQTVEQLLDGLQVGDNSKHRQMTNFMIRFVHENYSNNITIKQLADELQLSKNYLGQIFRNVTGESFNQYVTRVRMEKAKQMIIEGKLYIYEIAEKVGYTNIPYFSSQFKKITGVNPTDLQKPRV
ncbi:response regulator [Paenibacillus septentrionalis]|uniref:Response regulator n=1 Tax=Paenibacillus septentrionalis TaxID=429342 RepID=A0ABW1V5P8_9BACL